MPCAYPELALALYRHRLQLQQDVLPVMDVDGIRVDAATFSAWSHYRRVCALAGKPVPSLADVDRQRRRREPDTLLQLFLANEAMKLLARERKSIP